VYWVKAVVDSLAVADGSSAGDGMSSVENWHTALLLIYSPQSSVSGNMLSWCLSTLQPWAGGHRG